MTIKTIFCALALSGATFTLQAQHSVIDCYKELAGENEIFDLYKLSAKGDKWMTTSSVDYPIEATVDTKNGYIQILDDGTGGGTTEVELALFRTAANQDIILAARSDYDGVVFSQDIVAYRYEGGKWKVLEKDALLPEVNYTTFSDKKLSFDAGMDLLAVKLEIPRYGTTAQYTLLPIHDHMNCKDQSGGDANVYCALLPKINYKSIDLKWDKTAQKFSLGEKK